MNNTLAWIIGSVLMTAGICLVTDWRTVVGIALVLLGGSLFRNVDIKDKHWME